MRGENNNCYSKNDKMPEIKTKNCTKCGKAKPLACFYKQKRSADGRGSICKECHKTLYRKNQGDIDPPNCRSGIDSWQQVDSVLRAMAESQIAIDKEQAVCDKRVGLIKKYSEETIEPHLTHKMGLENLLTNFLKEKLPGIKTTVRKFSFGQIFWRKGKITINLNTELADRRMGKP